MIILIISSAAWQQDSLFFPPKNERQHLPRHMNPSAEDLGNTSLFPATSRDASEAFPATARVNPARPTMPRASPAHDGTAAGRYDRPPLPFRLPAVLNLPAARRAAMPRKPCPRSPVSQLRSRPCRKPARAVAKLPSKTTGNLQFALIWTSGSPGARREGLGEGRLHLRSPMTRAAPARH